MQILLTYSKHVSVDMAACTYGEFHSIKMQHYLELMTDLDCVLITFLTVGYPRKKKNKTFYFDSCMHAMHKSNTQW